MASTGACLTADRAVPRRQPSISIRTQSWRSSNVYVLGLTATPIRRDGQQPIIFMQCGPIRHTAARPESAPVDLLVLPRWSSRPIVTQEGAGIQEVFLLIARDTERTERIVAEVVAAFNQGRKILVLTERTDHLNALEERLPGQIKNLFALHGRLSRKQRAALMEGLAALPADAPRVILATGKLVGEGFDHPPLDTLILAMPVSWKGTLQQYAGRLHREHSSKADVRIIDFVDAGHPALLRMWSKREAGYRAMGYRFAEASSSLELFGPAIAIDDNIATRQAKATEARMIHARSPSNASSNHSGDQP